LGDVHPVAAGTEIRGQLGSDLLRSHRQHLQLITIEPDVHAVLEARAIDDELAGSGIGMRALDRHFLRACGPWKNREAGDETQY
jgi:hypothetical protein